MIADVLHAYRDAVAKFEQTSDAMLKALAADHAPAPDLIAAEAQARSDVLAARSLLLAEIALKEAQVRADLPASPESDLATTDEVRSAAYRDALLALSRAPGRLSS